MYMYIYIKEISLNYHKLPVKIKFSAFAQNINIDYISSYFGTGFKGSFKCW